MQSADIARKNAEMKQIDWNDKQQRKQIVQNNLQQISDAWVSHDPNKLSADVKAAMDPKDYFSFLKSAAQNSKSEKEKAASNQFFDKYANDLIDIQAKVTVDPTTGKSNAQELYKPVYEKILNDMNNGVLDRSIVVKHMKEAYGLTNQLITNMRSSRSSETQPPIFGSTELDASGNPINQSSYLTNTPEGIAKLQQDQMKILTNPNANKIITKSTFNNAGLSGIQVIKPPSSKKKKKKWYED
jgi:hypothetical protein